MELILHFLHGIDLDETWNAHVLAFSPHHWQSPLDIIRRGTVKRVADAEAWQRGEEHQVASEHRPSTVDRQRILEQPISEVRQRPGIGSRTPGGPGE